MVLLGTLSSTILLLIFLPFILSRSKQKTAPYILLAMAVIIILGISSLQYIKTDDEFITFRVVDHIVGGKGLTYNNGERYASITNLGWSLVLSLLPLAGLSLVIGSRWLSLLAAIMCLWGVSRLASNLGGKRAGALAPFLMLFLPFFQYWATSGLETMAFCALCAWSLALATVSPKFPYYAITAGISAWLRPEAPLIFLACLALNFYSMEKSKRLLIFATAVLIFLFLYSGTLLLRLLSYGTLIAPTTSSKIPTDLNNISGGISAFISAFTNSPILFLGLFLCLPLLKSKKVLVLFILSLCGIGYYIWLGLDVMKHERLLGPFIPVLVCLTAVGAAWWSRSFQINHFNSIARISISLLAVFLILPPYYMALNTARSIDAGLANAHRRIADYLVTNSSANDVLAVQDAGIIGYYWQGSIADLSGVFDHTIVEIHRSYGRVSNNSQALPSERLTQMNREVADYVLDVVKPRYIVQVYTISPDGKTTPSMHNHNIEADSRFLTRYRHIEDYYFHSTYILKLYELSS